GASHPRQRQPAWGQKCLEVSTVRGRRFVGGIGSGGAGGGSWACVASRSHRAHCGRWVRPANGLGSLERLRRDGLVGTIGWWGEAASLGHSPQSIRKTHTNATSPRR